MEAPSSTAAPFSGEHPQHRPVARPPRPRWLAGGAIGGLALVLGALGWLAHRHVVLLEDHDRMVEEISRRYPDRGACERDREELDRLKRELEEWRATDKACNVKIEAATREYRESLNDARSLARIHSDRVSSLTEEVRLKTTELQQVNSNLSKLKSDLTAASAGKDRADQLHRDEQTQNRQLRASLSQQHELLSELCRRLQSAPAGSKPPKECQGIK
jgi:chromosome segregation ATPase